MCIAMWSAIEPIGFVLRSIGSEMIVLPVLRRANAVVAILREPEVVDRGDGHDEREGGC